MRYAISAFYCLSISLIPLFQRNGTDQELYGTMSKALNATGRPILFSLCNWGESEVWKWGGGVGQMFRIQMDVRSNSYC